MKVPLTNREYLTHYLVYYIVLSALSLIKQTGVKCKEVRDLELACDVKAFIGTTCPTLKIRVDIKN